MKILSVDPGFERVGIAILEKSGSKESLLYSECLTTNAKDTFEKRLLQIGEEMRRIIKKWEPHSLAIETLFFNTNKKTATRVAEARGVIMYEGAMHGLIMHEYTPLQVKIAVTGYGKAPKKQVDAMVRALTNIKHSPKNDDEIDAIAIGLTCAASLSTRYPQKK